MKFRSVRGLTDYLQKEIDSSLEKDVFPIVRRTMQDAIQKNVYDAYTPQRYKRRYYDGGLIDPENFKFTLHNGNLTVWNETPPNQYLNGVSGARTTTPSNSSTARLVERGIYNPSGYGFDYWHEAFPRPFIEDAVLELKKDHNLKAAIKAGLSRRGISAR